MSDRLLLSGARLPDGRLADVLCGAGRIARIGASGTIDSTGCEILQLEGALLLPGLIEGHIHLDKTLLGARWVPHREGHGVAQRIAREKEIRAELRGPSPSAPAPSSTAWSPRAPPACAVMSMSMPRWACAASRCC